MKHRFPSPTTPRHGRNGCLAVIAAGMLALTAFGGTAANATTHRHTVVPNVVTCNSTDFRMQNFIGTPEGFGWMNQNDLRYYLQNRGFTPTHFCQIVVIGGEELQQNGDNRCLTEGNTSAYFTGCIDSAQQTWRPGQEYGDGSIQWVNQHDGKCLNGPHVSGLIVMSTCAGSESDSQSWFDLH